MSDDAKKLTYNKFREAILSTTLNSTIIVTFLSILSSFFLKISIEGVLSAFLCLAFSVFSLIILKKYSYKISATLFLTFLFIFLPINHFINHSTGQAAAWWYHLLPMVVVFFLGKDFALGASIFTGILAATMDLTLIKISGDFINREINNSHITDAIFHAVSIFLCGLISYYYEKNREFYEDQLTDTTTSLHILLENKTNEKKLITAKEEAINATKKLKHKQNQLNDILENSPGIVYQFQSDMKGNIEFTYVSKQAIKIHEIASLDLKNDFSIILKMVHKKEIDSLKNLINESTKELKMFQWSGRIVTGNNNLKYIVMKSIPRIGFDDSVIWNGILIDITKEKEMEIELFHQKKLLETSSRLASLGEISAGIAHEINNPLAIILLKVDDLREREKSMSPELIKGLDYIDDAASRICKIVESLRYLSKERNNSKDDFCNIYIEVKRSLELVKELYRNKGVKISYNIDNLETFIQCPSTYIHQILLNLVSNAKDAILSISDPEIKIIMSEKDGYVCLSVKDNGPGIPKEIKDKIFEPFFTTKGVNDGTGIGLSMCYSMINEVNGKIICNSNERGTRFECFFRIIEKNIQIPDTQTLEIKNQNIENYNKKVKILVVDDESDFLNILTENLSNTGYNITPSNSGISALNCIRKNHFDVIISDQKMPRMTGTELFKEIKANNLALDSIKIIMSGHLDPESGSINIDKEKYDIDEIIKKPFRISSLISLLGKIPLTKNV